MSVTIHLDIATTCECIPYLQSLLLQANNVQLSGVYKQKLIDVIILLMQHLDDETARESTYLANIDEIHTLRDSAFSTLVNQLKDSIQEPQSLIDLRTPVPPTDPPPEP